MIIILIGAQGSGKGTQADRLSQPLGIRHVASGDLFRKAFDEKTELGVKAKAYLDRGELVPDDITVTMILDRIKEPDCAQGVLLDGFPRTVAQAQALDKGLQGTEQHVDLAVYLKVPREELLSRLSGRYICRANQHVYNIKTRPPKVAGICDLDGSELYQRSDDTGEAVQKRLDIFFNETIQLLDYYGKQHKLAEVDGNQGIDQVEMALLNAIKTYRQKNT
ncbi:MAG TPA: adenylate kinase [Ktedonobacteraceae bacterium]|nr:adenylate kinase [Ktedonobacteraceae bacterium]